MREILTKDRYLTLRLIAEELNISFGSVQEIVRGVLGKKKLCARFVLHALTEDQKEQRLIASQNLIEMANCDPNLLRNIVTGNETWCFQHDPSTKRQTCRMFGSGGGKTSESACCHIKSKNNANCFFR